MKIALGTKSNEKISILRESLKKIGFKNFIIKDFYVESGISEQPLNENETIIGARNRAINALNLAKSDKFFGLGLEGGFYSNEDNNNFYLVCIACLIDSKGNEFLGISSKTTIPKIISRKIKEGYQFGDLIKKYKKNNNSNDYIEELISRKNSFFEAIRNAFLIFNHQKQ